MHFDAALASAVGGHSAYARQNVLKLTDSRTVKDFDLFFYHLQYPAVRKQIIDLLRTHGRPMICTEYMARRNNSRFENVMPMLKRNNVGAINWGFVSGKTNTIFAWDEPKPNEKEPTLWFHDIFRQDKTPFDPKEVELIKKLNGKISDVKLMKAEDFKGTVDGKEVA